MKPLLSTAASAHYAYTEHKMRALAFPFMAITLSPSDVRRFAVSLPIDQDRAEVRLGFSVMTGMFMHWLLLTPALYVWAVDESPIYRVALLSVGPGCVALFFVCAIALVIPHFFCLLFMPRCLGNRKPRQSATAGAVLAALLWGYLGTLAQPLDLGLVPLLYWLNAGACVIVGLVYGISLNNQQLRTILNDEKPKN